MSKTFRTIFMVLAAWVQILQLASNSSGQDLDVRIKIGIGNPPVAEISGYFPSAEQRRNPRNFSFVADYGDANGLGERISNVFLADRHGKTIGNKRFGAGEYVADSIIGAWKYQVNLATRQHSAAAHVSWSNGDTGLLMFGDLLPQGSGEKRRAKVQFDIPIGWKILTTERLITDGTFDVDDIQKASFVIGPNWRSKDIAAQGSRLRLFTTGDWQFSDDDAAKFAASIFDDYVNTFGAAPDRNFQIAIGKFPVAVPVDHWEADTRGSSIFILSSDTPFKSQSVQRLHEQLRHEIFHLWIPNGVNLTGNYDWFYEGFALYQSLKLGVNLNRIRFDDYLDTLSRACDIDRQQKQKLSLIEASKDRWVGDNNTMIYARGMLVAFLCDLALLESSKGKRSTDNLIRELYEKYRPPAAETDGNEAVLAMLRSRSELKPIVERNIVGAQPIDWNDFIHAAGLETELAGNTTKLKVAAKPRRQQKDLLDKLGYNNWRKLASK